MKKSLLILTVVLGTSWAKGMERKGQEPNWVRVGFVNPDAAKRVQELLRIAAHTPPKGKINNRQSRPNIKLQHDTSKKSWRRQGLKKRQPKELFPRK